MAKAKAKKAAGRSRAAKTNGVLDLPVEFGNVNVGDKTARIGITVGRGFLSLAKADDNLCERRLTGRIIAKPAGWDPDQPSLEGLEDDTELEGTFDVKGINVSADHISCGLTWALSEIDVATLAGFAKRAGRVMIADSSPIPEPVKEDPLESMNGDGEE